MVNFVYTKSNQIDNYGVKWHLSARSNVDKDDGEEYLNIYLHAEHHFESK